MKKIGLWKKLASWLLVFLLVLQIPVNVFAEGWISETNISADNDFAETENAANVEEEENTDFIDDEKIEETENDYFDLKDYSEVRKTELLEFLLKYTTKGYVDFCKKCAGWSEANCNKVKVAEQIE